MRRQTILLTLAIVLAGCGSVETKEEKKPAPVVSQQPQDAPPAEEGTSPPLGRPRAKVPPLSVDKRSESLLHDDKPH